jgi:hypothetical protein
MAIKDEPDLSDLGKLMDGISVEAKEQELTAKIRIPKDQVAALMQEMSDDKKTKGKKPQEKGSPAIEKISSPKDSDR